MPFLIDAENVLRQANGITTANSTLIAALILEVIQDSKNATHWENGVLTGSYSTVE